MKKIVRLMEEDLVRIINQVISEQREMDPLTPLTTSGNRLNRTQGQTGGATEITTELDGRKLDGGVFGNGLDRIDKNSNIYISALNGFKKLATDIKNKGLNNVTVNVEGGASAVGSAQGYDNKKLAEKRAQNFVKAILQDIPGAPILFNITSKVGTATKRNSPEANAEQYVKITVPEVRKTNYSLSQGGRDNTAIRYGKPLAPNRNEDRPYMILKVFYNEGTQKTVLEKMYGATRGERAVFVDVTKDGKACNL